MEESNKIESRQLVKRVILLIALFGALGTVICWLVWNYRLGLSFGVGAILAGLNFFWLVHGISQLLNSSKAGFKRVWLLVLKFPIVIGLIALVYLKTNVHPMAFMAGFLSLSVAVLIQGLQNKNTDPAQLIR